MTHTPEVTPAKVLRWLDIATTNEAVIAYRRANPSARRPMYLMHSPETPDKWPEYLLIGRDGSVVANFVVRGGRDPDPVLRDALRYAKRRSKDSGWLPVPVTGGSGDHAQSFLVDWLASEVWRVERASSGEDHTFDGLFQQQPCLDRSSAGMQEALFQRLEGQQGEVIRPTATPTRTSTQEQRRGKEQ